MTHSTSKIQNPKFSLPRYDRYKDSGVEWVGKIPSHWDVKPGRVTLSLNKEKNAGNIEETVLSLSYGRLVIKPPEKMTGLVPESLEGYQIINPGDIIIRPTDLQNDWTSLRVGLAKDRGIITSAYLGLKHDEKVSSEYLYYLLHSYDLLKVYYGMGTGLRQNLSWDDFKYLPLTLPPKPEQDSIVAFLDQKTAEIDALIAKKQRQIELLDEQKAILINRAVTRGLNPNAKLKPSGIAEIGSIPDTWNLKRVRHAFRLIDCKHLTVPFNDGGYRLISIGELDGLHVDSSGANQTDEKHFKHLSDGERRLRIGDLIFSRNASVGKCSIVIDPTNCSMGQDVCLLRPEEVDPEFAIRVLRSPAFQKQIAHLLVGSTFNRINIAQLKDLHIPVPPSEDLPGIFKEIKKLDANFSNVRRLTENEIQSLKVLRSTLIAHAVTGRIKV